MEKNKKVITTGGLEFSETMKVRIMAAQGIGRNAAEIKKNLKEIISDRDVAESAIYSLPRYDKRAGKTSYIRGLSISFVKELAREYGHLDYGISVIEQGQTYAKVIAYCYDLKANISEKREWKVILPKRVADSKNLSEEAYKFIYSEGAKRMRSCLERILPQNLQNFSTREIEKSLMNKPEKTLPNGAEQNRFEKALEKFKELDPRITEDSLLESVNKLGPEELKEKDYIELQGIFNSIKDKIISSSEFFKFESKNEILEDTKIEIKDKNFYKGLTKNEKPK